MARDYELMYIVRPDLDEEGVKATMDSVQGIIETQGGQVEKTTAWGKRRLAYEIQKLRDGHYVLLDVSLDAPKVKEVERALRIHDNVIRHLVTARPEGVEVAEDGPAPAVTETTETTADAASEPVAEEDAGEETTDIVDEDLGVEEES